LTGWRTPEPVGDDLKSFRYRKGKHLQRVWISDRLELLPAERVLIGLGAIDTAMISDRYELRLTLKDSWHRTSVADCQQSLLAILSMPPIDDVLPAAGSQAVYRLDLAITEMDPGQYFLRDAVPYGLGIGVAWLQVEGMLTDERSKTPVFAFVERRRNGDFLGFAWLRGLLRGESLRAMPGRTIIRELTESIALDLLREIRAALTGPLPAGARQVTGLA
jgi:hypothetical protein